jgi:hypothetical protein
MAIESDTVPSGRVPASAGRPADPGSLRTVATAAGFLGLVVLNLLVVAGVGGPLRPLVGFPVVVLLPGALALRAIGLDAVAGWAWLLRVVALSIAGLTAVSLVLGLLPGAALSATGSLIGLDLLVAALAAAVAIRHRSTPATGWASTVDRTAEHRRTPARGAERLGQLPIRAAAHVAARLLVPDRGTAWVAAAALVPGAAAVWLAVAGASRLDAGGSSAFTVAALVCAAVAVLPAALAARRRDDGRIAGAALYLLGLAVLLATSLRGAGVTGHDIKIEYRVFTDTFTAGSWGPGGANTSYDSCLSITVLPSFLARLLGLAPLDVFTVCFPLLFALVPVAVMLIARHVLPPAQALVAGVLCVAFPTFVNDMTMLNRQQIATLFFAVAVLTLLDERPSRRRTGLLAVLAVGLTVSHYTTTYVAAVLLLGAWAILCAPALVRRRPALTRTGLGAAGALLVVLAAGWATVTGIDAVVGSTVRQAADAVGSRAEVSSDATAYSLVGGSRRLTDQETLDRYVARLRTANATAEVVPAALGCVVRLLPADVLRTTPAGTALADVGIDPGTANSALRTAAVVLYQVGAIAGTALLCWLGWSRRRRGRPVEPDRLVVGSLAAASLLLLAGTVVVPQLSDDYGPLRLFQQALTVLAAGVVLAVATAVRKLRAGAAADRMVVGIAVGCLLTTSGVLPQLTGDYAPQLNLNNAGSYFRAYYAQSDDLATSGWIDANFGPGSAMVADSRDNANLRALTRLQPRVGLAPGAVPRAEPVLVTSDDGRSAVATAVVGDRVLRYEFPLSCVSAGRSLLHADGGHLVYGPAG